MTLLIKGTHRGGGICGGVCCAHTPTYPPILLSQVVFSVDSNIISSHKSQLLWTILSEFVLGVFQMGAFQMSWKPPK